MYLGRITLGFGRVITSPSIFRVSDQVGGLMIAFLNAENEAPSPMVVDWSTARGSKNSDGIKNEGKTTAARRNPSHSVIPTKAARILDIEMSGFPRRKRRICFRVRLPSAIQHTNLSITTRSSPRFQAQAPSVTVRIKLALDICRTLLTVHTAGWLRKNIRSENILFFPSGSPLGGSFSSPYLTGFTFSRVNSTMEISDQAREDPQLDIYRHPHTLGEQARPYAMYMDLYSLAVVLVEIAEWRPLKHIIKKHVDVTKPGADVSVEDLLGIQSWLVKEQVSNGHVHFRMGEVYGEGNSKFLAQRVVQE